MTIRCRSRKCKKSAVQGLLFCKVHKETFRFSPTSGDEPAYEPAKWSKDPNIRRSHNCYSYSMNAMDGRRIEDCATHGGESCEVSYHQPGSRKKTNPRLRRKSYAKCKSLIKLIKDDIPQIKPVEYHHRCPVGSSKIALVIDPSDDYHFYRQDPDGYWSHKPGSQPVTRLDADNVQIINPATAERDYTKVGKSLNYTNFCGLFCVPRRMRILLEKGGARKTRKK
jgi:hypothetical protein